MTNSIIQKIKSTEGLDNLPIPVVIFNNEQIFYINKAGYDLLDVKNPVLFLKKKRSVFDFLLPEYHKVINENNEKILSGKKHERHDFKIKCARGNIYYIESRSNLIDFCGHKAIQTIIIEATERKKQEEELFKTGELFSLLNKHAYDIFFKFDFYPKPNYSFISDSLFQNLGYKKSEFLNDPKYYLRIIHPEDKDKFIYTSTDYQKFLSSKQKSNTIRFYNSRKEIIWLETVYTPVYDNRKNIISIIGISRNVTDQILTQKKLTDTQEKFDLISTNAGEVIYFFTYQPEPKYIYISPSVKNVLGYETADFYKDPFFINKKTIGETNELKKHEIIASAEQKKNTLQPKRVTYCVVNKKGNLLWMEDIITPIKDKKGKIKFIFGIVRNITALKEKETELNQKWSDYRELLNQAPMAFFIHDNGICKVCNKEALRILAAKSPESVYGKYLIDFIVPEQRQTALERMKLVFSGKELDYLPYQITNYKGKTVSVELKSVPIKYNGVWSVLTIIQDITQKEIFAKEKLRAEIAEEHNKKLIDEIALRKKAEKKLLTNEKQLIEQAAKLSAIFESSSHLVWTVNKNLELSYFNSNYTEVFHKKYGILPKLNEKAGGLQKSKCKEIVSFWHPLYKRALKGEYIEMERKDLDEKGNTVYREVFISPIKDNKGKVFEIACLAHDITKNKKFEKQNIEQAAKMKAIFESGTSTIWTVDKNGIYTSFNRNFAEAVKMLYGKYPEVGKKMVELKGDDRIIKAREFWNQKQKEAFTGKVIEFMAQLPSPISGRQHFQQIYLRPIFDNNNEVTEVSGIGFDVTDKVINEQKINNQAAKLNAIFEGSSHYIWTINRQNELTSYNKNYEQLIKKTYGVDVKLGKVINKGKMISHRDYNNWWNKQYEKAFSGEAISFETSFSDKQKSKIYLDIFLNPIYEKGEIVEVSGIAQNITDRVLNEERIKEQSAKLKAIFESGNQLIWTANRKRQITSFNQNLVSSMQKYYGFTPELNKTLRDFVPKVPLEVADYWDEKYDRAFSGNIEEFVTGREFENESKVFWRFVLYPIKDASGEVNEVSVMGIDITENKLNEERITQSLREKEVLLKEVHHRVKNNMQVISSILNLQSSYVTDKYALNLLKESQNRIKTMAYIHESLYQNKTFSSINFNEYITTLTSNILHSYTASISKIRLAMDLQKVILNLDSSIPAGLIINELITNAIKHAFNNQNKGNIYINLFTRDNVLFLEVSDDGSGFPSNVDFRNTNSLGLQLVNTLVEQLNGNIELKKYKEKGTSFLINFPM